MCKKLDGCGYIEGSSCWDVIKEFITQLDVSEGESYMREEKKDNFDKLGFGEEVYLPHERVEIHQGEMVSNSDSNVKTLRVEFRIDDENKFDMSISHLRHMEYRIRDAADQIRNFSESDIKMLRYHGQEILENNDALEWKIYFPTITQAKENG